MKWITREHPRVDRVACPWLIEKFVDKSAEFLYVPSDQVPAEAQKRGATPYDIKDVELGHHGPDCSASVVAVDERRVVRTVALPGRPRWAVFDGPNDRVFVNIQDPAIILALDAEHMRESARIEIGSAGPHGLALASGRLFCAADGGELVVVDEPAMNPRVMTRLPLRGAPDVVMQDGRRRRLYVAIGSPGVVSVFDIERRQEIETIETEPGAH